MRVHRGRNADRADDERNQADKTQEGGRAIEPSRDIWVRFAEVGDHRFRESLLEFVAHGCDGRSAAVQLEEQAMGSAAPKSEKSCTVQRLSRKHDTRTDGETAGHTIGLYGDNPRDAEILTADLNMLPGLSFQSHAGVVGKDDGVAVQSILQRAGRSELKLAVEREQLRIDSFQSHENRIRAGG